MCDLLGVCDRERIVIYTACTGYPDELREIRIDELFVAMRNRNGEYGDHDIAWFNDSLFKHIDIPALTAENLTTLHCAASLRLDRLHPSHAHEEILGGVPALNLARAGHSDDARESA